MTDGTAGRDAEALRRAADVLLRRSRKPRGIWLQAMVRVLRRSADRIEQAEHGRWTR